MRSIFSTGYNTALANVWLLVMRLSVCGFMLTHGLPKFVKLINGAPIKFADPLGFGTTTSLVLAVFAEVFCSIFLAIGFATRLAAFFLLFTMAVAAFFIHANDKFGTKELSMVYLLVYLTLFVYGAGRHSVDQIISGGGKKRR